MNGNTSPKATTEEAMDEMTPMIEVVQSIIPAPHLRPVNSFTSEASSNASSSSSSASMTVNEKRFLFQDENEKDSNLISVKDCAQSDEKAGRTTTSTTGEYGVELKDDTEDENSPISEVAAVVPNTDDPSIPCMTFRFWVMGLISILTLSFVNQVIFFREAPMVVSALVIQLLSYPVGQFMARVLPTTPYNIYKFRFSLNPGPFNVKEHVLITIMANCGAGTAYAVDIIVIQRVFYKQNFGFIANLLLIITTQLVGYGMAGILRRYLVYPAAMIWPSNLVTVALFNTLHTREELQPGQWTRQKFFAVFSIASFCYYWIPAYIFPVATALTLLCYIDPKNVKLSQLTGSQGLGMGVVSLDWNTITSFLGSPLIAPYWAQVNIMMGFILIAWIMVPVAYYSDIWDAKKYPILTSKLFTVEGYNYNTLSILTPAKTLDNNMYAAYGPLRIATFFAIR
ncbi:hypothetical protein BGX26_011256 [Mortierella sp. AD094]|nr:hypothetical protein BGX26_011256 [Mortierella sp. AD094]